MMGWEAKPMTITVTLKDEVAQIIERQLAEGRYPDAESAVAAALMLLDDAAMNWDGVDTDAVRRMIADSDAQGGEISFEDVARRLAAKETTRQR
jgi:Arc/MetJ-type ribon-helix-helix transcriptional regulator